MARQAQVQQKCKGDVLASVLTYDKVNDLLDVGLTAEEIARATATSATSIYARKKSDPSRRGDLDVRIGRLYFVVSELRARDIDDASAVGWLTSPNLVLDGQVPLDVLGEGRLEAVREAAHDWAGRE